MLSRADQRSFAREPVDLSLIAEDATETLLPLADQRGVTIETTGEGGDYGGSSPKGGRAGVTRLVGASPKPIGPGDVGPLTGRRASRKVCQ